MKKFIASYGLILTILITTLGVSAAAFTDSAKILGATFSVGSSDLKLLMDLAGSLDASNLYDELVGPTFENISPNWETNYLVKLYNNSPEDVVLFTVADYETANDPNELRQDINVEPFLWDDNNNNGVLDAGELGNSLGVKTIVKWKTEGFDLGLLQSGEVLPMVFKFSTGSVSAAKQGSTATFDFLVESVSL
ncbi:MAG: hypothetical protein ACOZAO_02860 [Patescibacteria group bacterium]